jgi:N-carbamoylputrescine amidase
MVQVGLYRKMHIQMTRILRKFYFTPGDLGFKTIPTKKRKSRNYYLLGSMGTWSCLTALQGAEVLFTYSYRMAPRWKNNTQTNQQWCLDERNERSRCSKWSLCCCCNRIGLEKYLPDTDGIEFWGAFYCRSSRRNFSTASHDKET